MEANSRTSEFPSRSSLGHLVVVLIGCSVRRILLRWWHGRFILRTRGISIHVVSIPGNPGVLGVPPLVVSLVWLMVIVSIVAAVRIVRPIVVRVVVSSVVVPAISLIELVTVLLLLLRGTSVVVPSVRVVAL